MDSSKDRKFKYMYTAIISFCYETVIKAFAILIFHHFFSLNLF